MQQEQNDNLLHHVKEVEIVYNQTDVNRLLKQGWVLLSVGTGQQQTGQHDYTPCLTFCVGKIEK